MAPVADAGPGSDASDSASDGAPADGSAPYELLLEAPARGFQVRTVGTEVEAGDDVEWCEVVVVPGTSDDVYYVNGFEGAISPGSHHLIVTAVLPGTDADRNTEPGQRVECISAEAAFGDGLRGIFGLQQPRRSVFYPEGIGRVVRGGQKLVFDYHYVNFADRAVPARAALNFHTVDASEVEREAYDFSFSNFGIRIPPGESRSFTAECAFDQDVLVWQVTRHTHRWGTDFSVWYWNGERDGTHLWTSTDWEHEIDYTIPDGPVRLAAGEGFRFECNYTNTTDRELRFGTLGTDEMCILFGIWWVAEPGQTPVRNSCSIR